MFAIVAFNSCKHIRNISILNKLRMHPDLFVRVLPEDKIDSVELFEFDRPFYLSPFGRPWPWLVLRKSISYQLEKLLLQ